VPVVRATSEKVVPGGAANCRGEPGALGDSASASSAVTGQDAARDQLIAALEAGRQCRLFGRHRWARRRTTQKLRIIGAHQQVVRIDHEDVGPCDPELEEASIAAAVAAIDAADVVVPCPITTRACARTCWCAA
jgi:D-beta-D-heptose 7-phosphate kinase/D-beta-D-heptose 1-phosphate adenosyltransferase